VAVKGELAMTSSTTTPQPVPEAPSRSRSRWATRITAFTPLWVLIVALVASPRFFPPMFAKPPEILGIPLGLVLDAIAMVWMLIGVVLIWDARSRLVEALVLFWFTIPATLVVVFSPALILIMQNLAV
jgi:hypothetical protein